MFSVINSVKIIVYNSLLTLYGDLLLAGGWVTEEVDLDTDFSDGLFLWWQIWIKASFRVVLRASFYILYFRKRSPSKKNYSSNRNVNIVFSYSIPQSLSCTYPAASDWWRTSWWVARWSECTNSRRIWATATRRSSRRTTSWVPVRRRGSTPWSRPVRHPGPCTASASASALSLGQCPEIVVESFFSQCDKFGLTQTLIIKMHKIITTILIGYL